MLVSDGIASLAPTNEPARTLGPWLAPCSGSKNLGDGHASCRSEPSSWRPFLEVVALLLPLPAAPRITLSLPRRAQAPRDRASSRPRVAQPARLAMPALPVRAPHAREQERLLLLRHG